MDILVIGASGTIGRAVTAALTARGHTVRAASRSTGTDVADPASLPPLDVDAVVCCAASGGLTRIDDGTDEEFLRGLHDKLLGQVLLTRRAVRHLRDGGSITLTAGRFTEPTPGSAFGALTNTGLSAFAAAVAPELPRGLRVNVVSPGWVSETLQAMGRTGGTPAAEVAARYVQAVEDRTRNGATLT